jgi:hypothetical protein
VVSQLELQGFRERLALGTRCRAAVTVGRTVGNELEREIVMRGQAGLVDYRAIQAARKE